MKLTQKRIKDQVIVITGATSGIGLATARMAAEMGARLVLIARNKEALEELNASFERDGHRTIYVVADVVNRDELKVAVQGAISKFGGFDTWVNDAGVSIYGKLEDVPEADSRKLFDTNFWGLTNGSFLAVEHLRERGGTLINIGSTLSDRAIPIQGMYCASKHAVKGFTDALRMELEAENAPISVTLIKPAAIDTPYKQHAKNFLSNEPQNPPPVYAPEAVAEAILFASENPVRDLFVGGGGKAISVLGKFAPRLTDKIMEATMIDMQQTDRPAGINYKEGLHKSLDSSLNTRGGYSGHVAETSLYTRASQRPLAVTVAVGATLGIGLGLAAWAFKDRGGAKVSREVVRNSLASAATPKSAHDLSAIT